MVDAMTDALAERLAKLDCCAVSDALDQAGIAGVALGLSQLTAERRICGQVLTVALDTNDGRASHRHLGTAAVEAAAPGKVIVVAHKGRTDVAGWGGILSLGAKTAGAEGVIIDGASRDIDEAKDLDLPIFGRCGVPRTARGRIVETAWNEPVEICGVTVTPGDYVVADGSGVAFIPSARASEIIAVAEKIVRKEQLMAEAVRTGKPISAVMGANYEDMLKDDFRHEH